MNSQFLNREKELDFLLRKYRSKQAELLIFRGRRRVGKTFLLKEFANRVNGLYLMATISSQLDQLNSFSQSLGEYFHDPLLKMRPFSTWEEFFLYLNQKITKRTAVIIDEYPYLIESHPGLSTILQKHWDENFRGNPNIFLVLNGSALSMMEKETLNGKSPLYGRRTGQWFVEPFNAIENNRFFSTNSLIRAIEWYAISGGVPFYSQILARHNTPLKAIEKEILTYGETLFEEVEFLLRGEFRNPRSYFPILKAIALGSHKFGEISSKTGYDRANLTKYLSSLMQLQLIRREVPVTEDHPAKSKKGLFFLNDYFMNFWFRFVFPYQTELETGQTRQIFENVIKPNFDFYVAQTCEPIIRQLFLIDFFNLNLEFERLGRFWNRQAEIDIFGYTRDNRTVVGEIKWTRSPVNLKAVNHLKEKYRYIEPYVRGDVQWVFVSRSGFRAGVLKNNADVIGIDLNEFVVE